MYRMYVPARRSSESVSVDPNFERHVPALLVRRGSESRVLQFKVPTQPRALWSADTYV